MQREQYAALDGTTRWFDADRAWSQHEHTQWDGNNHVSKVTGSQWDHEALWVTAGGACVISRWSQRQGVLPSAYEVAADEAAQWLLRNETAGQEDLPDVVRQAIDALEG